MAGNKLKEIEDKTAFEGTKLTGSDISFISSSSKLLSNLISSLDRHLGDVSEGIVYAMNIVDLTTLPDEEVPLTLEMTRYLNRKYAAEFQNLLMLVDLVLSLPASSYVEANQEQLAVNRRA